MNVHHAFFDYFQALCKTITTIKRKTIKLTEKRTIIEKEKRER